MVGQIEIINWLLCVYLCYKGYEILQRAQLSPKENKKWFLIIAWVLFVSAVFIAIGTFIFMEFYVLDTFNDRPTLNDFTK
jgi:hypothetical protein